MHSRDDEVDWGARSKKLHSCYCSKSLRLLARISSSDDPFPSCPYHAWKFVGNILGDCGNESMPEEVEVESRDANVFFILWGFSGFFFGGVMV